MLKGPTGLVGTNMTRQSNIYTRPITIPTRQSIWNYRYRSLTPSKQLIYNITYNFRSTRVSMAPENIPAPYAWDPTNVHMTLERNQKHSIRIHGLGRSKEPWGPKCRDPQWSTRCKFSPKLWSIPHQSAQRSQKLSLSSRWEAWPSTCSPVQILDGRMCMNSLRALVRHLCLICLILHLPPAVEM